MTRASAIAFIAASAGLVYGQFEGWVENQVNASIALWSQPRAAVIRDTAYLDGGFMYWAQGLSDGTYGSIESQDNPLGLMFAFNFSQPFKTSDNVTALFRNVSKARGASGNANNEAPNYWDGALLGNDAQVSLYGGLVRKTDGFQPPREDDVLTYQAYPYGTERDQFRPGFNTHRLPEGMTRYVAFGGAVNVPSENKAFYFSGLRGPEGGEIFQRGRNMSENAQNISNYLITLDLERQRDLSWGNITLPDKIQGRANPEVVWVPVSEQGILVVLGGVTYPDWAAPLPLRTSENPAQSKEESDEFMRVIDIYDIASGDWFKQETEGGPTALTRGCAVVAAAQDQSSFNIYYYGGYSGVDPREEMSDEVWVLSIPSFTWTLLSEGRPDYGRSGHKCFTPYPDQMMVIGGVRSTAGSSLASLMGGLIQVYNLTSGTWLDEYHPEKYADYGVPSAVRSNIGGDATGQATVTTPSPSGWTEDDLADIFDSPYDMSKVEIWYPYGTASSTDRPIVDPGNDDENDDDSDGGGGGGGLPAWVAPTLGVVLGLVFLTALLVAFCLWRKRKILRRRGYSEPSTDENGTRIMSWIRGQPTEHKAPTVTTSEDTPSSAEMAEVRAIGNLTPAPAQQTRFEMADTTIAELPDTSRPPELSDTGLTPVEIINKHSRLGASPPHPSTNQTSYYGSVSGNEASSISRSSGVLGDISRGDSPTRGPSPLGPPSPPLSGSSAPNKRVFSGVSAFSERETSHLRQISEATVSSASDTGNDSAPGVAGSGGAVSSASSRAIPPRSLPAGVISQNNPLSPVDGTPSPIDPGAISPPTAGATSEDSDDYITARRLTSTPAGKTSSLRRSVFRESEDDMGGNR